MFTNLGVCLCVACVSLSGVLGVLCVLEGNVHVASGGPHARMPHVYALHASILSKDTHSLHLSTPAKSNVCYLCVPLSPLTGPSSSKQKKNKGKRRCQNCVDIMTGNSSAENNVDSDGMVIDVKAEFQRRFYGQANAVVKKVSVSE
jgi:hypothetical protein